MIFSWFRNRRRRKLLATPAPTEWAAFLNDRFPLWCDLLEDERARLVDITRVLVAEKEWVGCGGFEITEEVKVTIAAQAGLLLLNIPHDYFRNVDSVLVYPTGYQLPNQRQTLGGLGESMAVPVLGHAQLYGPVVLSWRSTVSGGHSPHDGRNLVFHEFAHKLDMMDGVVNGTPVLRNRKQARVWVQVMTAEYERLQKRPRKSLIRSYGATNVAEFFAVVTEVFFERPRRLRKTHPALYGVLADFYQQDPAGRGLD